LSQATSSASSWPIKLLGASGPRLAVEHVVVVPLGRDFEAHTARSLIGFWRDRRNPQRVLTLLAYANFEMQLKLRERCLSSRDRAVS
jgi:hypothetical protein